MLKPFVGKTGRVLKAVGCRVADRQVEGKPVNAMQLAIKQAVERAVSREVKIKMATR